VRDRIRPVGAGRSDAERADTDDAGGTEHSDENRGVVARLRDGSPVGAWMLKAHPSIWDIGAALRSGTELDWWRLAPTYRAELVEVGHPCVLWITRGDARVPSGLWAVGKITGAPHEDVGDPDDDLWRDESARRQLRPQVPVQLRVLDEPVPREAIQADPRLRELEILRVPRIGNPAAVTPDQWWALQDLFDEVQ
jgi:hypothetical protein